MDILTFISEIVSSIVWPALIGFSLYFFVKNPGTFIRAFKSLKYKDFELVFKDEFLEAENNAEIIRQAIEDFSPESLKIDADIAEIAKTDKPLAIFKSWQKLEIKIYELIKYQEHIKFTNIRKFMEYLLENRFITREEMNLFENLRVIRNEIVHAPQSSSLSLVTSATVAEYNSHINLLIERLENSKSSILSIE